MSLLQDHFEIAKGAAMGIENEMARNIALK